jgi:sec-independent protein translocase protein TatA
MALGLFNLTTWEIVGIVAVGLLLFGSRLPAIARSLGKSVIEFKKGVKEVKSDLDTSVDEPKKIEDKSREVPAQKVDTTEKVSS